MAIRRSGASDQRRRRVLLEENLSVVGNDGESSPRRAADDSAPARSQSARSYSEAALDCHQPPVTSLIPSRIWTLSVLLLAGLCAIAGILTLYEQVFYRQPNSLFAAWRTLDVDSPGSLAGWFSSLLLLAATLQSVQVLRLRRHKTDDYRGRYRVWGWMAGIFFLMATASATQFHADVLATIRPYFGTLSSIQWNWAVAGGLCALWLVTATRLGFEIRSSRGAMFMLVATTGLYGTAAVVDQIMIASIGQMPQAMARTLALMLANLGVCFTVTLYARHVRNDAHGLIRRKSREADDKLAEEPETPAAEAKAESRPAKADVSPRPKQANKPKVLSVPKVKSDRASDKPAAPSAKEKSQGRKETATKSADAPPAHSEEEDNPPQQRKLSKAERRRLRKQQRRQRQAA